MPHKRPQAPKTGGISAPKPCQTRVFLHPRTSRRTSDAVGTPTPHPDFSSSLEAKLLPAGGESGILPALSGVRQLGVAT